MIFWIGQAVGAIAMVETFFLFQVTDRRKMLALKLLDDLLWITHHILIGGYTAALTTAIAFFREIVFFYKGRKPWASNILWAIGFSLVFAACAPLTWANIFSIFPAMTSVISTWSFWVNKTSVTKLTQLPAAVCMLIYCVVYSSYSGMLTQIITIVSIVLFFARSFIKKGKENEECRSEKGQSLS